MGLFLSASYVLFGGKVCFLPFLTVPDGDLDDLGWLPMGRPQDCHCHACSRSHLSLWPTSEPGTEDSFPVWTCNHLGIYCHVGAAIPGE